MKRRVLFFAVVTLTAPFLLSRSDVNAGLISISSLSGNSFESPVVADGTQSETMTGWVSNPSGSRVEDPSASSFSSVPDGNQAGLLFKTSSGGDGWFYQVLRGSTDANPAVHNLTGNELAGSTLRFDMWVGRGNTATTYNDNNMHFRIGSQAKDIWNVHDSVTYEKLTGGGYGADVVLDLGKDEWRQVTSYLTFPDAPINGGNEATLSFNILAAPNATGVYFDAITVSIVPEPSTLTFSMFALLLMGMIGWRRGRR